MSGQVPIDSEIIFYSSDNARSPKIHVIHILAHACSSTMEVENSGSRGIQPNKT